MSRKWILDSETKGTGAQMVPLEKARAGSGTRAPVVVREPRPLPAREAAPAAPRRFKVVDVMTRQVVAEDLDTRGAVEALRGFRSVVDVNVYVRQDDDWYQLSQGDRGRLWALRDRA